jgi:hypothetical protein
VWGEVEVCGNDSVVSVNERDDSRNNSLTAFPKPEKAPKPELEESKVIGELQVVGPNAVPHSITLDLRFTAREACLYIGEVLKVRLREEFGLAYPQGGWLDESQSLYDLGLSAGSEVAFKKKFFVADEELRPEDGADIELMYPQCAESFRNGAFECSLEHAIGLGALQACVQQHQYQLPEVDGVPVTPSVSELAELLPLDMRNGATVKCVMDQLEGMTALSKAEAMFQFVHICSLLGGYGISAYVVGDASARRSSAISSMEKTPVLLGVGRQGIFRMHYKTQQVLEHYAFDQLEFFAVGKQSFVLSFGIHRQTQGHWGVSTRSGRLIAQLIDGYIRLLKKRNQV